MIGGKHPGFLVEFPFQSIDDGLLVDIYHHEELDLKMKNSTHSTMKDWHARRGKKLPLIGVKWIDRGREREREKEQYDIWART